MLLHVVVYWAAKFPYNSVRTKVWHCDDLYMLLSFWDLCIPVSS